MLKHIISLFFLLSILFAARAQPINLMQQGKPTSIRGLSVVDNKTAWISGSKGYVAFTTDGGKSWAWQQIKGFEQADFRSVYAFSAREAIIMSSGTPALILKTIDGGANWKVKYRNSDTTYFLDAMDFANVKHGLVLGDPINNKFTLLETTNSGDTWHLFGNPPQALPNEAAFAASGTCLRFDQYFISIVTGGSYSRKLKLPTSNDSEAWSAEELLIKHGKQSQGAFSLSDANGVIVGGDYKNDNSSDSVAQYYFYDAKDISALNGTFLPKTPPAGYQSCVEGISRSTYISTGTSGTNITTDGGKTWTKIDGQSFNVCRKARYGTLVLLAGNDGKIAIFEP